MDDKLNFDPQVADLLDELEKVSRPHPGLGLRLMIPTLNQYGRFGSPQNLGPVVHSVERDGRAEKAGLMQGDMILQLNGSSISDLPGASVDWINSVCSKIKSSPVGTLQILIRREGKEIHVTL